MNDPELPTSQEEKAIARLIENDVDFATEQKHIHEIERGSNDETE